MLFFHFVKIREFVFDLAKENAGKDIHGYECEGIYH